MKAKFLSLLAVALVVGLAGPAKATLVTYTTVGTFTGGDTPGTNVYTDAANGIVISFDGITSDSANVPPPSSVSFGQFNTTGTTATSLIAVASGFTLDIIQTAPTGGTTTFSGTLGGSLADLSSTAFVQFTGLGPNSIGDVTYQITEGDDNTPGKANIVPPSTQSGLSSVEGQINTGGVVIPEPSTLLMAGLGGPLLLLAIRRRQKGNVTA